MATYEQSTEVNAQADALFAYLSDVANLPKYMESMTSAKPAGGEKVKTTAMVEGQEVQGEAWFRVSDGDKKIEWGAEGPNDYHGSLEVTGDGDSSSVSVAIHTQNTSEASDIDDGLKGTLANIKRLVEAA